MGQMKLGEKERMEKEIGRGRERKWKREGVVDQQGRGWMWWRVASGGAREKRRWHEKGKNKERKKGDGESCM